MDFRSWVLENFSPVVMVVASPAVETAVQRHNGLTVTDVLRPSGYFRHLNGASCSHSPTTSHIDSFADNEAHPRLQHVATPCVGSCGEHPKFNLAYSVAAGQGWQVRYCICCSIWQHLSKPVAS